MAKREDHKQDGDQQILSRLANIQHNSNQQILNRLANIQHKVDSIEQTNAFALRADKEKHEQSLRDIFRNGKRRAQVYLAANGARSVQEIADHIKIKRPNVSAQLKALSIEGILEIAYSSGGKDYWGKKPLDHTIRITRFLCDEFSLNSDGTEKSARK
jgi:predicted Rossmann fold nucleotide-binding protein DprA/Smf involved in DNA uptake